VAASLSGVLQGATPTQVRCAIYTRKSTEEGLDQEFNTLDAQREAAEAYITSQRHDGWSVVPDRYDDGGFTGANMERPAVKRLLADVEAGKVNCIVVYKVDRLSRALLDFMKMMEILDKHGVTFVSVTQPFNTTTSPGRLLLNMLFSFAQFEREMISERTRDKMSAARRKGKWVGGNLVLGYDLAPKGGSLVLNPDEAERVRQIFDLYLELGSLIPMISELDGRGWKMKAWTNRAGHESGGARFTKTTLHNLLTNVIYTSRVKYEGKLYAGEHARIVDDDTWNRVQEQLNRNGRRGGRNVRNKWGALLKGLVRCASCECGMIHTYAQKRDKPLYRYYVCVNAHQRGWNQCQTRSVSAPLLEGAVLDQIRRFAQRPEMLAEILQRLEQAHKRSSDSQPMVDPGDVADALMKFDPLWEQLRTWEQEQFVRALVHQVRYEGPTRTVTVGFRSGSIKELCEVPSE
jgi:site-specific DNA recombinase